MMSFSAVPLSDSFTRDLVLRDWSPGTTVQVAAETQEATGDTAPHGIMSRAVSWPGAGSRPLGGWVP